MISYKKIIAGLFGTSTLVLGGVDVSILEEVPIDKTEIVADYSITAKQLGNIVETTLPWKDQAGIKVKYDMGEPTLTEKVLDKRKKEVITETVTDFDGGFKVDILLNEKPDTNVFCYAIEGAENYDFLYQTPLTEQDIADGYSRPPEIEGSYAVYHKTLANYRIGGENYATGKVMHIPRPQVWSLSDVETKVWADMDYSNGSLCVTVPQDFLDKANYPVRVDPTFGYTTKGATLDGIAADQLQGPRLTAPATSKVDHIVASVFGSLGTEDGKGLVFASSTLNLVTNGVGSEVTNLVQNQGGPNANSSWYHFPFTTPPDVTSGTGYVMGIITNGSLNYFLDLGTGVGCYDTTNSYTSPANIGTCTATTDRYSLYYYYYGTTFSVETYDGSINTGSSTQLSGKVYLNELVGAETFFQYGTSTGAYTATTTLTYQNATTTFSATLNNIEPLTQYFFRAGAYSSTTATTTYGDESSFVSGTTTNTFVGTQGSDIGHCYQSGTATCFTGVTNPGTNVRIGYRTGVNFGVITSGFRFPSLTIPSGSTINSARFYYTAYDNDSTNPPSVAIYAEDVDNSTTFSTTTGSERPDTVEFGGSRATTTASVAWTLSNQVVPLIYKSPDISSVIQEVVDRAGWVSGNAISVILAPTTFVDNFNGRNATSSAYLILDYTAPVGTSTDSGIIWFD